MAVNWFRKVFVVRVRGRMRKIAIERFDLASICNFLGEFFDAEMVREVPNR
jgi:hypothetical protein